MICEYCGNEQNGSFQSGRFCNYSCKFKYIRLQLNNNRPKIKCNLCDRFICALNITSHLQKHEREEQKLQEKLNNIRICGNCQTEHNSLYASGRFCCKKCAKAFSTKINRKETNIKVSNTIKQKLLNGEQIGFCKINFKLDKTPRKCKTCDDEIPYTSKLGYCKKCLRQSEEYKIITKDCYKNCGGYRKNSGRGKCGWYKGYFCQSSYELAWVIYNIDNNIYFQRNIDFFEYIYEDKIHKFYPDFKINNNTYIEIKGYNTLQFSEKINQFPNNLKLIILYEIDLKNIFEYVIKKHGCNFIELYEGNPHNKKMNKCKICGDDCLKQYCSRTCSGKAACIRNHKHNK